MSRKWNVGKFEECGENGNDFRGGRRMLKQGLGVSTESQSGLGQETVEKDKLLRQEVRW